MEEKNFFSTLNDRTLKILNKRPVLCHTLLVPACLLFFVTLVAYDAPPLGYPVFTSFIYMGNSLPESLLREFFRFLQLFTARFIPPSGMASYQFICHGVPNLFMFLSILIPQLLLWAYRTRRKILALFILAIVVLDITVIYANGYYSVVCFNCVMKLAGNQTISEEELYLQCGRPLYTTQVILNNEERTKEVWGYYTNGFSAKHVVYKDDGMVFVIGPTYLWLD